MQRVIEQYTTLEEAVSTSRDGVSVFRLWPLALAMLTLSVTLIFLVMQSLELTQGHFGYLLDDAYIHMAIAKNFAQHGVWGATPYEFSSSSSSLLWTAALALIFFAIGPHEVVPAALNLLVVSAMLGFFYAVLRASRVPDGAIALVLLLAVFLVPLPEMVFTGMEHLLHALVALVFVYLAAQVLSQKPGVHSGTRVSVIAIAPLVAMTRYEGLFVIAVVIGLLFLRRELLLAVVLGGASLLPITAYALLSVSHGWYFLPNSVLLKGEPAGATMPVEAASAFLARGVYAQLADAPYLILLVVLAAVASILRIWQSRRPWDAPTWGLVIFVPTALLHMHFVGTRWFHRYDAYLVALGMLTLTLAVWPLIFSNWTRLRTDRRATAVLALVAGVGAVVGLAAVAHYGTEPFVKRAYGVTHFVERARTGIAIVPAGVRNIYEQQYQMGRFLRRYYQGAPVAANDIGAISYLADIRLIDLFGLASMDVAERKRAGRGQLTKTDVDALTLSNGVKIAVVYDRLLYGDGIDRIPDHWIKVLQWEIQDNVVAGAERVSFYAVDLAERERLATNLRQFGPELPASVRELSP